ncbi:hypothetical protein ACVFI8_01290 [Agarivorans sp. MS3-6]|uniref:hypothetical protein n=1 Tax=Agarivorans sp. TSD2052 TaxID=2937286 RepID=UPI00200FF1C4|nr:hypothetical protein [Agarivorans sp. TSD2052]UPW20330.1 hypothetical protein M0C34_08735 [Agarivorans sp. TSD2052]
MAQDVALGKFDESCRLVATCPECHSHHVYLSHVICDLGRLGGVLGVECAFCNKTGELWPDPKRKGELLKWDGSTQPVACRLQHPKMLIK